MADLLEIRTRLVDEEGAYDLVVDAEGGDYDDAGANDVINDAIIWLNAQRNDLKKLLPTASFALLAADTDENYWATNHPHMLVNAARRMREVRQRNTQGVADWDNAILGELHLLHANEALEDMDAQIAADPAKGFIGG